ncbi:nucleotide disphospho-sugar-binding domain-containing protein [Streptomyces sp. CoH27]|uniref:nucleotide disphospho-sugar-binding domain-containing protein n=1 Tax=Streptomyces sp. CoH27 TaxID=2875763 RepID=UPI001CD7C344|nr:nucleotide disphospho-sugar-binding domain-containing protein [Streptomyces sp. CoH27]
MRVLIMATPVASHFTPIVPLAWALRTAGHEVLVAGQPDIVAPALAAGLQAFEIGDLFDAVEALTAKLPAGKRPNQAGRAQVSDQTPFTLAMPWLMHARYLMKQYLEFATEWQPDLVVSDPMEFSALLVGGVLGVPVVHHRWDIDPFADESLGMARTLLGARFARHGLAGPLPGPSLVLDSCPPSVRGTPDAAGGAPTRAVRYVPYNGAGALPEWLTEPAGRCRVAVTLGGLTASLNGVPLFRSVVDALEAVEGVETVVTLPGVHHAELGPVGPATRVVEPVPLNLFLDSCALVVHHGGTGTALTACSFGLPQLVLPQIGNESLWAARLRDRGVARELTDPAAQDDPKAIRDAVHALIDDPAYQSGARKVADEMAALPSPAALVPELEALVAGFGAR